MSSHPPAATSTFGFFTVVQDPAVGLLGGYLLLDGRGRPVEFHCTAPLRPSRAEEILFGTTLLPHFYSERIGAALLAKASKKATLLLIDQPESWGVVEETTTPVVFIPPAAELPAGASHICTSNTCTSHTCASPTQDNPTQDNSAFDNSAFDNSAPDNSASDNSASDNSAPIDTPAPPLPAESPMPAARLDRVEASRRPAVAEALTSLQRYVDLTEPFERIREAIHEAGQLGSRDGNREPDQGAMDHAAA